MSTRTVHPFPARMAPSIALDWVNDVDGSAPLTILDPMCGSGTALSAAHEQGHNALGFDMDPLAVKMSRVTTLGLGKVLTDDAVDGILESSTSPLGWWDEETEKFAHYWFGKAQHDDLHRIASGIATLNDADLKDAAGIALSKLIVTKAPKASLAADTSHSRPHKVQDSSEFDVIAGFRRAARELALRASPVGSGTVEVHRGDARKLPLGDGVVDRIVTSPPYLNAIDYLRGHRLSLIWLGHSIPELRAIRSASIGAERALSSEASTLAAAMVNELIETAPSPDTLPKSVVLRYAHDMVALARELARVSRGDAEALFVVGNSTVRGNFIANDRLAERAMTHSGFEVKERWEREIPASRRYLPIKSSNSEVASRMRTEVVTTYRRCR